MDINNNCMYLKLHDCSRIYKSYTGKLVTQRGLAEHTNVREKSIRSLVHGDAKRISCQGFAAITTYLIDKSLELVEAGHIEDAWTLDDIWGYERVVEVVTSRPDMVKPDEE